MMILLFHYGTIPYHYHTIPKDPSAPHIFSFPTIPYHTIPSQPISIMKTKKTREPKAVSASKGATVAPSSAAASGSGNQPRNLLLQGAATIPLTYEFDVPNRRNHVSVTVRQQDDDETWPGGAVWDLGIVLASLCVAFGGSSAYTLTLLGGKPKQYPIRMPDRLTKKQKEDPWFRRFWVPGNLRWLELGCGVALTGLVAAAALRPRAMLLTDLGVVVDQVTQPNTQANQELFKGVTTCMALPLCWGNGDHVAKTKRFLEELYKTFTPPTKNVRRKKGTQSTSPAIAGKDNGTNENDARSCADVVIIGDVAYQHKPGAPSHFDVLHETLLQLLHEDTLVIFGTRIRMPASVDLLEMFRQDLEEVISPPVSVDEIDPASFGDVKHNMTIHFMRRKTTSTVAIGAKL